jgi:hypothetical protein
MGNLHVGIALAVFLIAVGPAFLAFVWRFVWLRIMASGIRGRMMTMTGPESYFTRRQQPDDKTFPQFAALGEDIMLHILSFVTDAPFEQPDTLNYASSLTHAIPFVSKQLQKLAKTDTFWMDSLVRQIAKEPELWLKGLVSVARQSPRGNELSEVAESARELSEVADNTRELVEMVRQSLSISSCDLYRLILNTKVRFKGPIFCMFQPMKLGHPYGLHFFEPRYRRLIADVMAPFPVEARQGGPITCEEGQNPPVFIHANVHPVMRSSPAFLVQVVRCRIYPADGRADVFLLPVGYLRIEAVWEQPRSGHLHHAQCIRVGLRETEELENAASSS